MQDTDRDGTTYSVPRHSHGVARTPLSDCYEFAINNK